MKILLVSDTHRNDQRFFDLVKKVSPLDLIIHLGDSEGSQEYYRSVLSTKLEIVSGNNDFFSDMEKEKEIVIGNYKIFITHGHYYNVGMGTKTLLEEARARDCNVAMFGHTHKPYMKQKRGVLLINPGSLSFPRQDDRKPTYMIMDVDRFGEAHFTLNYWE